MFKKNKNCEILLHCGCNSNVIVGYNVTDLICRDGKPRPAFDDQSQADRYNKAGLNRGLVAEWGMEWRLKILTKLPIHTEKKHGLDLGQQES